MKKGNLNRHKLSKKTVKQTVKKYPVSPEDIEKLISQMSTNSDGFKMQKVQYSDVVKELTSLRNDTSTGSDEIPTKFKKPILDVISSPFISTMSETSMFPHQWKTTRAVPVLKVNYSSDDTDYRPIPILPTLSKIAERLILKQLLGHIEEQLLLKSTVTGYRKGHSRGTTLLKSKDDIKKAMKSEEVTLATLVDFSKAFDTIAHDKVITKLHKLGFWPEFIRLISSYLSHRSQFLLIDANRSKTGMLSFGVPQGSIFGPIICNLYSNDLPDTLNSDALQYPDDTFVSAKPKDLELAVVGTRSSLNNLDQWANENNLTTNVIKTECMLFSTKQMRTLHQLPEEKRGRNACQQKFGVTKSPISSCKFCLQ